MKKIVSIVCCAIMMAVCTAQAQDNQDNQPRKKGFNPEQRIEKKAQRICRELALDDATAKKFTETYREYYKELKALRTKDCSDGKKDGIEGKKNLDGKKDFDGKKDCCKAKNLTEAEAAQMLKARFEMQEKTLSLQKKYYDKYSKFLTQKQIMRIYEMEKPHGDGHGKQRFGKPGQFGQMKGAKMGKGIQRKGMNGKGYEGQQE